MDGTQQPTEKLPHGIKGRISEEPSPDLLLTLLAFLITLTLCVALFFLLRKLFGLLRKKPRPVPETTLPKGEQIMRDLAALSLPAQDDASARENYFSQLSLKLREMIELRTALPVTDQTFEELQSTLTRFLPMGTEEKTKVLNFFALSDAVTFAGRTVSIESTKDSLQDVLRWCRTLNPSPNMDDMPTKGKRSS